MSQAISAYKFKNGHSQDNLMDLLPLPCLPKFKDTNISDLAKCIKEKNIAANSLMRSSSNYLQQVNNIGSQESLTYQEGNLLSNDDVIRSPSSNCTDFAGFPSQYNQLRISSSIKFDLKRKMREIKIRNNLLPSDKKPIANVNMLTQQQTINSDEKNCPVNTPTDGVSPNPEASPVEQKVNTNCSNKNKYSSESTTEFPLSSPRTAKSYRGKIQRPIILKNTLPADSFERKLAMLTTTNPQMTFQEKLSAWQCDTDLSDVEDVNNFDDAFKQHEERIKKGVKTKHDEGFAGRNSKKTRVPSEHYDFTVFRSNLLQALDKKSNRKNTSQNKETSSSSNSNVQKQLVTSVDIDNKKSYIQDNGKGVKHCTTSTVTSELGNVNEKLGTQNLNSLTLINQQKRACSSTSDEPGVRIKKPRNFKSLHNANTQSSFIDRVRNNVIFPTLKADSHHTYDPPAEGLIKLRLDYSNDKKGLKLKERKSEIFGKFSRQQNTRQLNTTDENNTVFNYNYNLCASEAIIGTVDGVPLPNGTSTELLHDGVFHQQHEFCNYLGLTGMSTATAVANAVAELSKCNMTRRSLRVHRLQQQEKEKSTKEKNESGNSKDKLSFSIEHLNEKSTEQSQVSANKNNVSKEPEIKIVCQIAAANKKAARKMSKSYVQQITKHITEPTKENILRTLNQNKSSTTNTPSASTSDSRQSSYSTSHESEAGKRRKNSKSKRHRLRKKTSRSPSISKNKFSNVTLKEIKSDVKKIHENTEQTIENTNTIHERIQKCLEATRQLKPSIYIVSTINSHTNIEDCPKVDAVLPPQSSPIRTPGGESQNNQKTPNQQADKSKDNLSKGHTQVKSKSSKRFLNGKRKKRYLYHLSRTFLDASKQRHTRSRNMVLAQALKNVKRRTQTKQLSDSSIDIVYKTSATLTRRRLRTLDKKHRNSGQKSKLANKKPKTVNPTQLTQAKDESKSYIVSPQSFVGPSSFHYENNGSDTSIISRPSNLGQTKDNATQNQYNCVYYLSAPNRKSFRNPLKKENGEVLFLYYEMDTLIAVQEQLISFWKFSRAVSVLTMSQDAPKQSGSMSQFSGSNNGNSPTFNWILLDDCRRLTYDQEIDAPFNKRICVNNSMPMYIEMRCRNVPRNRRECNLLFLYINVYYYHDDELHARMHSVQLDAVQSVPENVIYTTIPDTRYFVMTWPQENILNKTRSGLCKYALTPYMDTLASIRDFKNLRHEICQLECTGEDKLIGLGITQITIWDHRSGDVLMNYDLNINIGRNLGSIYFPSHDVEQDHLLLMFQYVNYANESDTNDRPPEVICIGCNISHTTPSHRILQRYKLPTPAFKNITNSINTGDHLIITADNDEEIWISCNDPSMVTCVPAQHTKRFYMRGKMHVVELHRKDKILTVDSFSNYVLRLAASGLTY